MVHGVFHRFQIFVGNLYRVYTKLDVEPGLAFLGQSRTVTRISISPNDPSETSLHGGDDFVDPTCKVFFGWNSEVLRAWRIF